MDLADLDAILPTALYEQISHVAKRAEEGDVQCQYFMESFIPATTNETVLEVGEDWDDLYRKMSIFVAARAASHELEFGLPKAMRVKIAVETDP